MVRDAQLARMLSEIEERLDELEKITVPTVSGGTGIGGGGTAPQVAFFATATTITSDAGLSADAANDLFIVASGGGIGIGDADEKLEFNAAGTAVLSGCNVGVGADPGAYKFYSIGTPVRFALNAEIVNAWDIYDTVGGKIMMYFDTNNGKIILNPTDNHNVGIGGASASTLLHLEGTAPIITFTDTDTGGDSTISASNASGSLYISADENSEVANSTIVFEIDGTEEVRIDPSFVGFGTGASALSTLGGLDIQSGGISLVIAADVNAATRTDNTRKFGRFGYVHYDTDEEPCAAIVVDSDTSYNRVTIGGGTNQLNAATSVRIFTAANTTTVTGTLRAEVKSDGGFFMYALKSGATQAAAGAAASELWETSSHATLPDHVVMIGV